MFNDNYNIDTQYQELLEAIKELELDLYGFIGRKKSAAAAVRARVKLIEIKKICSNIRVSIAKQKQDNKSQY